MKIGIFFGGQSREREISFAGGRTVYDNLNKNLFEAVPIFVDSVGNFIHLDWQFIYKGTIRDFYPPFSALANSPHNFQIYIESLGNLSEKEQNDIIGKVGKKIAPSDFKNLMDFAFLALHGPYGEDGNIQGILEWYNIPYTGCGILPSAIGINKIVQKRIMSNAGFKGPKHTFLRKEKWQKADPAKIFSEIESQLGLPFVVKAPYQGSSIGIAVVKEKDIEKFTKAVNRSFFIQKIEKAEWEALSEEKKVKYLIELTDIRDGIGMPVMTNGQIIKHPEELFTFINDTFKNSKDPIYLESLDNEEEIIMESFIEGKEFSCIVIQEENGEPISLPPTEIIKSNNVFDYRSKYLPGMTRKVTPINLPEDQIENIRKECERLFRELHCNVYARIDGFINSKGEIFLNDPNTTSGMLPSSFFFHQAAEIGMNPSQFLTYIIRTSLSERTKTGKKTFAIKKLLKELDENLQKLNSAVSEKTKVAVIMGGFSSERHISVESGRNIYEKLSSSIKYEPIPVFLTGNQAEHELYVIPINIMLKDNADDIKEKVSNVQPKHPVIKKIMKQAENITKKYVSNVIAEPVRIDYPALAEKADAVFIALHGRPGEDGSVQRELEKYNVPYNGSGIESSQITINKYETNRILREHGMSVANHMLVEKRDWDKSKDEMLKKIESGFKYPIIAKPADDGCSSAVKKIKNREELIAFAKLIFGYEPVNDSASSKVLNLKYNEEFPCKDYFLIEDLVSKGDAKHFLEVTGGLLTKYNDQGKIEYEVFEPSETLATGDVLSLEEKFLAGEGQNITPARFAKDASSHKTISAQVRNELKKVAEILNIQGYARIDAFVRIFDNNKAETIIIEVNSLPGMTPATCIFHQTAINGYKPYDFIDRILNFGIQRVKKAKVQNVK
ncbi:MAG: D-alanine--D-alanine ligase [Cytophagaceae bacterium]|nr:D-alanine--D-alanine ligase [Cytophagaceae bacterium]